MAGYYHLTKITHPYMMWDFVNIWVCRSMQNSTHTDTSSGRCTVGDMVAQCPEYKGVWQTSPICKKNITASTAVPNSESDLRPISTLSLVWLKLAISIYLSICAIGSKSSPPRYHLFFRKMAKGFLTGFLMEVCDFTKHLPIEHIVHNSCYDLKATWCAVFPPKLEHYAYFLETYRELSHKDCPLWTPGLTTANPAHLVILHESSLTFPLLPSHQKLRVNRSLSRLRHRCLCTAPA